MEMQIEALYYLNGPLSGLMLQWALASGVMMGMVGVWTYAKEHWK